MITDAASKPPSEVIPGTFWVESTNVTEVVLAPLEPVTANLLASVVTVKLLWFTGNEAWHSTNATFLTLSEIVDLCLFESVQR